LDALSAILSKARPWTKYHGVGFDQKEKAAQPRLFKIEKVVERLLGACGKCISFWFESEV
jgi:hypothetical protein